MADGHQTSVGVTRRGFLAACGAGAASLAGCLVHGEDGGVRGTVVVDGSNTVLPHSSAVAEEFLWRQNRVNIPVRGSGTGAGFERFSEGATDIQNASRPISDTERERCEANDISFIELEALRDGIAIFAHPDNTWCDSLSVSQLRDIWEPGSSIETWQDIDPEWPDEPLSLFGRDPASGTFDSFTERMTGEVGAIRDDYSASADTNVIVRGVSGNRYALGWGGAGFYYENPDDLSLVGVDDPDGPVDGPVKPSRETIESEEYTPLWRSMYVYINEASLEDEATRAFVEFYFREIDDETHDSAVADGIADPDEYLTWTQWAARRVGFYAASDEAVATSNEAFRDALDHAGLDLVFGTDDTASDTEATDREPSSTPSNATGEEENR